MTATNEACAECALYLTDCIKGIAETAKKVTCLTCGFTRASFRPGSMKSFPVPLACPLPAYTVKGCLSCVLRGVAEEVYDDPV